MHTFASIFHIKEKNILKSIDCTGMEEFDIRDFEEKDGDEELEILLLRETKFHTEPSIQRADMNFLWDMKRNTDFSDYSAR